MEFKYISSEAKRNFEESVEHVIGYAEELDEERLISSKSDINLFLNFINNGVAVFDKMRLISQLYHGKASLNILSEFNIDMFKYNAYVASKLFILSQEYEGWGKHGRTVGVLFCPIMSDAPALLDFLKNKQVMIIGDLSNTKYNKKNSNPFFNKNVFLALSGEWAILRARVIDFLSLNEAQLCRDDLGQIPAQEFLLALCDDDIVGMRTALDKYFEKKLFKKSVRGADMFFDFYLQMQVLMYAKIAAIHGFDLGIDSPYAPKELIEYKPLDKYEDPYDFMKEFDYDQPQQVWIDKWNEKMRLAKENQPKKKKGFLASLFKW